MSGIFTDYAAQEAIDERIERLEAKIRRLRRRRNTYSAVFKLPVDILSLIFVDLKRQAFSEGDSLWGNVFLVCQLWRKVLLATPCYWAHIRVDEDWSVKWSIQLSKQAPLSVICDISRAYSESDHEELCYSAGMVLEESERLQNFCLKFGGSDDIHIAEVILDMASTCRTPLLRRIEIEARYEGDEGLHLSEGIFFMDTQSLRVLCFKNVVFPPEIPELPALKTLIIDHKYGEGGVTLPWIVKVLRQTPNVEVIELFMTDREVNSANSSLDGSPVPLPSLTQLSVKGHGNQAANLLDILDFPKSTIITATLKGCPTNNQPFERLLSRLTSGDKSVSLQKMLIDLHEGFRLELSNAVGVSFFRLNLPLHTRDMTPYTRLCGTLPLGQVRQITFANGKRGWNDISGAWEVLFPKLTHLKTIEIVAQDEFVLLPLLYASEGSPWNASLEVLSYQGKEFGVLPALQEISNLDQLSQEELNILLQEALLADPVDVDHLSFFAFNLCLLNDRSNMGAPFQKIIIRDCVVAEWQVNVIRRLVEVDWDGRETVQ